MEVLAFGCSHTQGAYLPEEDRWPNLFSELTGLTVENLGYGGMGFFEILAKAKEKASESPKLVVLQKPIMNRYPWYCKPEQYRPLGAARTARNQFNYLPDFAKKIVLKDIFAAECRMLSEFRDLFSESLIVYWHYWFDYFRFSPVEFQEYDLKYEQYALKLGMNNLKTVWNPGDLLWSEDVRAFAFTQFCADQNMIVGISDGHPLRKHNLKVAERVKYVYEEMVL